MGRKRPTPKPGDIVEVQLDSCNAYLLVLRDTALGIFANCYPGRPSVATIVDAGVDEVVYASRTKIENGEWPVIGHSERMVGNDWWPPAVKFPLPSNPQRFMVVERGHLRPATEADKNLPLQVKLSEHDFLNRLRRRCCCPERITEHSRLTRLKPVEAAMSIDKNDVAERVRLVFEEAILESKKAGSALSATQRFFREELMDEEFAVPFWLSLADIALTHNCLTSAVACQAKDVIESGKYLLVVNSWNPEIERPAAEGLRRVAIDNFLKRLNSATIQ
jgi:hypothetical protein